ncbi:hypothetical protein JNUCC76_05390 [Leuconostoc sp. JNUCC 76]
MQNKTKYGDIWNKNEGLVEPSQIGRQIMVFISIFLTLIFGIIFIMWIDNNMICNLYY